MSQERRVYVGNLSYDVRWQHLKDFMRQAGEVMHADILTLTNGLSKGCGIVEYSTRDEARRAVTMLSNQPFMGRLVYVREDREQEPRFSGGGAAPGGAAGASSYRGAAYGSGFGSSFAGGADTAGRQIYVQNLPYSIGWQNLKDFFRQIGPVVRADVHTGPDGRSKGSGIVLFDTAADANRAVATLNGADFQGRPIEVRLDRFAGGSGAGAGAGGAMRGAGGFSRGAVVPANDFTDFAYGGGEVSDTIFVGNLPWATSNEDLDELFRTIGTVVRAEIQLERGGRSRGAGVVRMGDANMAEQAISRFNGYVYGNRPLNISFVRYQSPIGAGVGNNAAIPPVSAAAAGVATAGDAGGDVPVGTGAMVTE